MQCNTRQRTATHSNTLRHTAIHYTTPQHTAIHGNTWRHTATHGDTLRHTASHCNTRLYTSSHCCVYTLCVLLVTTCVRMHECEGECGIGCESGCVVGARLEKRWWGGRERDGGAERAIDKAREGATERARVRARERERERERECVYTHAPAIAGTGPRVSCQSARAPWQASQRKGPSSIPCAHRARA